MGQAANGAKRTSSKDTSDFAPRRSGSFVSGRTPKKDPLKDELAKTEFARKLLAGKLDAVTLEDVQLLGVELSKLEENGAAETNPSAVSISWDAFALFLKDAVDATDSELEAMQERTEVRDGHVSPEDLHRSLSQASVKGLLRQIRGDLLSKKATYDFEDEQEYVIDRDWFVDRVIYRVRRDDAFGTLPITLVYMIVFMFLVMYHLQIWNRQELERGLEEWIIGSGENLYGPFILEHVNSAESFFTSYLVRSGGMAIFGTPRKTATVQARYRHLRIASTSFLIGDATLKQMRYPDDAESSVWMLLSPNGTAYMNAHPNSSVVALDAALTQIDYLISSQWYDDDTSDLLLTFATYSERAKMYALTEIHVPLSDYGFVKPRVTATATMIHSYPKMWVIGIDVVYVVLILYHFYYEMKDMWSSLRLGCGEFYDYWTLWNVVDWCAIVMGFGNIGLWSACMWAMSEKCLHDLVTDNDALKPSSVLLTPAGVEEIHDALKHIAGLFFWLHICVAATTVSIVMKFFKAFQSNPRLQVVTRTLTSAAEDIFHFFVVFGTIFLSFAMIGHVLFGSDLVQFYTIGASLNTGVTVLMGEFGWYVDLADSRDILPSGTPRLFLTIWFVIYMFFVLLVLVNILLAVILKRYTDVNSAIEGNEAGAPTLWEQSTRYFQRRRETRGHVPLWLIEKDLCNDSDPAHPDEVVTTASLLESFSRKGMKAEQAQWIMQWLEGESEMRKEEEREDETTERLKRTERFVQRIAEELHIVTLGISECSSRLGELEGKMTELAMGEMGEEEGRDQYRAMGI